MKRAVSFVIWACVLLLLVWRPIPTAEASLSIEKGPYLQSATSSSMVVMWHTTEPSDSRIDFGLTSNYSQYLYDPTLRQTHEFCVSGLNPDTLYHYRVTSNTDAESVSSIGNTFQTAVIAAMPFRFAVYGDSRSQPTIHSAVAQAITTSAPRLVLHVGDFTTDGTIDTYWRTEFFNPAASLMANIPLLPSLGNHEQNSLLYYTYFDPPDGGGDYNKQWYSFDYGNCHFIVLDTDISYSPGSAQYSWLLSDLQTTAAEWIFVVHHHPAYSSGIHGGEPNVQVYLVPLYITYGVDMVFTGHDHLYERSYKDGVYYIVTGGGGAPLHNPNQTYNPYQQYVEETYHHCTIDINGATATFQAMRNDGSIFDSVALSHLPSPPVASFSANPTSGKAPLTVAFTDLSSGNPTSWSWDFGDGSTSTEKTSIHIFATAGSYIVTLTISNSAGSDTATQNVTVDSQTIFSYTIATNPPGLQIVVDGSTDTGPHTYNWTPGSSHTLSVASPQSGTSGTRYVYSSWSDGGAQTHTITVPSSSTTYTATFETQHEMIINISPGSAGTVIPSPMGDQSGIACVALIGVICIGYYPSGTLVTLTATPNTGYTFSNWSGDVSGTANPLPLIIDRNKTVTAHFAAPITLQSPSDSAPFSACSLYSPPTFSWAAGETFLQYEIQFSPDQNFSSFSVKVRVSGTAMQATITSSIWKKVLLIPGGMVYWRMVGTRANGKTALSEVFSIIIEDARPVESQTISLTSRTSLPTLSWVNNCNTKFKVRFGSDEEFTKKTAFAFNIKNPNDNEGEFTKLLASWQWMAIRRSVRDVSGSTVYWYVESCDGLRRCAHTDLISFVLTD